MMKANKKQSTWDKLSKNIRDNGFYGDIKPFPLLIKAVRRVSNEQKQKSCK